jgi:hypothetical protein
MAQKCATLLLHKIQACQCPGISKIQGIFAFEALLLQIKQPTIDYRLSTIDF